MTTIKWYYAVCPFTGLFFVAIDATINCYREVIWWHVLSDIGGLWGRKGKAFFTSMSSPRFCVLCTTISIEFNKSNQKVYKTMSTYDVLQKNVVGNKAQFWVVFIVGHIEWSGIIGQGDPKWKKGSCSIKPIMNTTQNGVLLPTTFFWSTSEVDFVLMDDLSVLP